MRTCDWKELKEGDVFTVPRPESHWRYDLGIYTNTGELLKIERGSIARLNGSIITAFYPNGYLKFLQPVEVFEPNEISKESVFISVSYPRVNNDTGADPEIFVVHGKTRKTLFPAFKFLPKQDAVKNPYTNAYAYRDGFAAEWYTRPMTCHGYFVDYLRDGLKAVLREARSKDETAQLTIKNVVNISATTMKAASDEEVALGCMPSSNAYGDSPMLPTNSRDFRLRSAGGHVHLGINDVTDALAQRVVKGCDVIVGIPAVAMFASIDKPVRRQFYGRAGEYRKPKHGIEYRVLSNAWLCTPEVSHLTLNLVRAGAKIGKADFLKYLDIEESKVRDIINTCDVKAAREYVMSHEKMYHTFLQGEGLSIPTISQGFKQIIEGGVEAINPDFENFEKNWRLNQSWNGHSNGDKATWVNLCRNLSKTISIAK